MVDEDIDGSMTTTFGPRSGLLLDWVTGTTWKRWAAVPFAVAAALASRHLPLAALMRVAKPVGRAAARAVVAWAVPPRGAGAAVSRAAAAARVTARAAGLRRE